MCVLLLTVMFSAAVIGPASSEAAAQDEVVLVVGVTQSVDSLNPLTGYLVMAYEVYSLMYEMLLGVDGDLNPTPQIAESWTVSEDLLTWTYNIRHGMTWHDGEPVTAHDVNWTYNLIITDEAAGSLYIDYLRNVTDVRALDDYTLRVTTAVPKATMLSIIIPILPKHLWENIPSNKITSADPFDTLYFPDGPVGSGPFKLTNYSVDDFVEFQAYDGYWGPKVNFDTLIYKTFLSSQAMLTSLEAGSIDVACSVPADSWETVLSKDNIEGQEVREISLTELGINVCPPELRVVGASENLETLNLSVRKAIAMAVDKDAIVEDVLLNLGVAGDTLIPPASARWHYNLTAGEEYPFNIAEANRILDESGYDRDDDGDGFRENESSGVELSFVFEYIVDNTEDETAAMMIQGWLEQVGIEAPALGVSESKLISDWVGMKYDLFIWGWGGDADPNFLLSVMTTDQIPSTKTDWSAWSDCFYSNPYYDHLFIEQQNKVVVSERQEVIYEMQRILYLDAPYVILYNAYGLYAYRTDRFTNWPDMEAHPGMTPLASITGGPWLYYEVVLVGENLPPTNVNAGLDTAVALNETREFTGYAEDDGPAEELVWNWTFMEPDSTLAYELGQTVSYKFEQEGTVTVTLTVTDAGGLQGQDTLTVTVSVVEDAGWISGYVKDSAGDPIVTASVTAEATSATTNSAGYYNMTVSAGTYDVTADASGYGSATLQAVVEAGNTTTLNFTLGLTSGTLSGVVTDADTGDPLDGATVSVRMGDVTKLATSDEAGEFEVQLLDAGTWNVTVTKTGYVTETLTAVIEVGETTTVEVELSPSDTGGGISTTTLIMIGAVIAAVVIGAAAFVLMKRRKAAGPPEGEAPPPPE
ncbi:MAG: ABC transporter substrate-binding protein [Candidatus Thermoplasmatota archaeon]